MSSSPHPPNEPTRSTKVWYDDGTIVIQAESTLFRVYKGILARHSTFFQDLFSLPQPSDAPTYDGVPFVELHDPATSVQNFLLSLHEWRETCSGPGSRGLRHAWTVAQLASKYCVDDLRQWAIKPFVALYDRSSLTNWLSDSVRCGGIWTFDDGGGPVEYQTHHLLRNELGPWDHVTAVNMARQLNLPDLLPTAFYAAATSLTLDQALDGIVNSDGSLVQFDDPKDARICAEGQRRIGILYNPLLHVSISMQKANRRCTKINNYLSQHCMEGLQNSRNGGDWGLEYASVEDGYCGVGIPDVRTLAKLGVLGTLCVNCRIGITEGSKSYGEEIWPQLAEIFQLEDPNASRGATPIESDDP